MSRVRFFTTALLRLKRAYLVALPLAGMSLLPGCEGTAGGEGSSSLIEMSEEAPGIACALGGQKLAVGLDVNGDGTLGETETQQISYVCNGGGGGTGLLNIRPEPVGEHCATGGQKIESGLDTNGNGALDISEVEATNYVCNGADGGTLLSATGSLAPGDTLSLDTTSATGDLSFEAQVMHQGQVYDHEEYGSLNNPLLSQHTFGPAVDITRDLDDALTTVLTSGAILTVADYVVHTGPSAPRTYASIISPAGVELNFPSQLAAFENVVWNESTSSLTAMTGGRFMFLADDDNGTYGIYDTQGTQLATGTLSLASLTQQKPRLLLPDGDGVILFYGDSGNSEQLTFARYTYDVGAKTLSPNGAPTTIFDGQRLSEGLAGEMRPDGNYNLIFRRADDTTDSDFYSTHAAIVTNTGTVVGQTLLDTSGSGTVTSSIVTASNGNWLIAFERTRPDTLVYAVLNENVEIVHGPTVTSLFEGSRQTAAVFPDDSFAIVYNDDESLVSSLQIVHNDGSRPTGPKMISPAHMVGYNQPRLVATTNNSLSLVYTPWDNLGRLQFITLARGYVDLKVTANTSATLTNYTADTLEVILTAR